MEFTEPEEKNIPSMHRLDVSWAYKSKNRIIRSIYFQRLKKSVNLVKKSKHKFILDIGTGCGILLPTLNRYGKKVVGVDVLDRFGELKEFVDKEKLKNTLLIKADVLNLPFKEGCFDLIFCLSVLEHVKNVDDALNEIGRILDKKGTFILGYPIDSSLTNLGYRYAKVAESTKKQHVSNYKTLRNEIEKYFKITKKIKYPSNYLPDFLSFYEANKCKK